MKIRVEHLDKRFGDYHVLRDVNLTINDGELVALLGPSGSGKTSLLRVIAGLEAPDTGRVLFDDQDARERSASERNIGFVFQHYALFRHMTVFENVAFGLRVKPRNERPDEAEIKRTVMELLSLVQLDGMASRYPAQLSGGQRQRVALARALAVKPRMLLLDEPFGALDAQVRADLRRWLRRLHHEISVTTVLVTHDQEEALEVADRVVIMNGGRIEQTGAPDEVYDHPATPFVVEFLGQVNVFHGRVDLGRANLSGIDLPAPQHDDVRDAPARGYVRSHDFDLIAPADAGPEAIVGTAEHVQIMGPSVRVEIITRDSLRPLDVTLSRERYDANPVQKGDEIAVRPRRWKVFTE